MIFFTILIISKQNKTNVEYTFTIIHKKYFFFSSTFLNKVSVDYNLDIIPLSINYLNICEILLVNLEP